MSARWLLVGAIAALVWRVREVRRIVRDLAIAQHKAEVSLQAAGALIGCPSRCPLAEEADRGRVPPVREPARCTAWSGHRGEHRCTLGHTW